MVNKYRVVDALYPIEEILNVKNASKNVKCIFHGDDRKPSSHIYENHLYCFTCGRNYYVTDIAKVEKKSVEDLYADLVERFEGEEALLEEFKQYALMNQPKEKIVRSETETITDFFDRYFFGEEKK